METENRFCVIYCFSLPQPTVGLSCFFAFYWVRKIVLVQDWQFSNNFHFQSMGCELGLPMRCLSLSSALSHLQLGLQNHSITAWLRLAGTCGAHLVHPLLQHGHPEQVAQDHVLAAFEKSLRKETTQPLSLYFSISFPSLVLSDR